MATITVDGDALEVAMEGADRLLALRSHLRIPLSAVVGVSVDARSAAGPTGLRLVGTSIPGMLRAGTFRAEGDWVFWDVRDIDSAVVIELEHEHYRRLVVEVADPAATAEQIRRAKGFPAGGTTA